MIKKLKDILKIGMRRVRMDAYGPVWVRMVLGDLFQGFPGLNPLRIIETYGLFVFYYASLFSDIRLLDFLTLYLQKEIKSYDYL